MNQLVQQLEEKTSYGWCSQIALYAVAKLDQQIPVRLVSNGGFWNKDLSVRTGGHTFLEYLDPKTQRWALADPTSYILAILDPMGRPLSAIELGRAFSLPDNFATALLSFRVVVPTTGKLNYYRLKPVGCLARKRALRLKPSKPIRIISV